MKTLLLDVDGVIADCATAVHAFTENLVKRRLPPPSHWSTWIFEDSMGLSYDESELFKHKIKQSDVAQRIRLYPDALEQVFDLKNLYDVVFVTAHWDGYPAWVPARDELLAPFHRPIIHTHHKHCVQGDILLDDRASTLERGGPWKPLLFDRPWNQDSKVTRIRSLKELLLL
jgi:5'(3')-deoxyribonucleotidase